MKDSWLPLIMVIAIFALGIGIGYNEGNAASRRSAIRAGVGQYYIPDTNSATAEFRWITNSVLSK